MLDDLLRSLPADYAQAALALAVEHDVPFARPAMADTSMDADADDSGSNALREEPDASDDGAPQGLPGRPIR